MKAERQAFTAHHPQIAPREVVAIDEMGIVTGMSRAYGDARRGNGRCRANWQRKARG